MSKHKTIIVWHRSDLRVHDHPALSAAIKEADLVLPLFIFDDAILKGKFASANRHHFLRESLEDLRKSYKDRGGDIAFRHGDPKDELRKIIKDTSATAIYYTADYSPRATTRDKELTDLLAGDDIEMRAFGGRLAVNQLQKLRTKNGDPYKVFTPFWKNWQQVQRRELAPTPRVIKSPSIPMGTIPPDSTLGIHKSEVSPDILPGGETAGRKRLKKFLNGPINEYHQQNNDMAADTTSRLSSYFHFGCISVREVETLLPDTKGAQAWHRQLAWRDFYHYVLLHFPHPEQEFQERYRTFSWSKSTTHLEAWKEGKTGYPAVDAAMRQLKTEGWMHNRARLIVGSFLTKDLDIDWRDGERHFMEWLTDGDMANNNGNWQWIASVGVDPAPLFRRLYNPSSQRDKYDPTGEYVRRYVPELKNVPMKYLSQPWTMPDDLQKQSKCIIGKDYPKPIVDHSEARQRALEKYRSL
ncbi:MAG: deoxyribodipyrimidine photo-lyase [Candidatus Microsaccharimonas sp.]